MSHPSHIAVDKIQNNADFQVVDDFGREWQSFDQQGLSEVEISQAFFEYFHIFPFESLHQDAVGFDMGCGSGRWAKMIAPRVKKLHCIDASHLALQQAKKNLSSLANCEFECASVSDVQLLDASQDFGYCLGVLHHIPDTEKGLQDCAKKLKSGAPFLLYLYYRFDNKPTWFKWIWKISDGLRRVISKLPFPIKLFLSQVIALSIYWPLSRLSFLLEKVGMKVDNIPLAPYRNKPLYFLRTDALDRFGTKLEKRFTKNEIEAMMLRAGFKDVRFSEKPPFWVALGIKA